MQWVMEMLVKAGASLPGNILGVMCTCCVPPMGLPRLPLEAPALGCWSCSLPLSGMGESLEACSWVLWAYLPQVGW